jgi:hypothetical protein
MSRSLNKHSDERYDREVPFPEERRFSKHLRADEIIAVVPL